MREVRFSPEALDDIEAIAEYTFGRFGSVQAEVYGGHLLDAIDTLREVPHLGNKQDHILPNSRRLVHESHSIFYEITESSVIVLRVLGPGQSPEREMRRGSD
jgi:toxin ParE1/3/4